MRIRLTTILLPALLIGGCGTVNRGMESVHQPVVQRTDMMFDVATDGGSLSPAETQRLAGWLGSLRVGYGDRIAVESTDGGYDDGVREAVAALAARHGLLVSDEVPITMGAIAPGTARVVVSRMTASVPGCPDHSRMSGIDLNANTASNQGCAVNANLAAMVARPEDLVRGQPGAGTADTARGFKAIQTMRRAEPTGTGGLRNESTRSGR